MAVPVQSMVQALQAYQNAAKATAPSVPDNGGGGDFAGLVKNALEQAVEVGKRSEQLSMAAIQDRADLSQVVTAVAEAELTLQTAVNVRDKIIEAYKSIIRMPV